MILLYDTTCLSGPIRRSPCSDWDPRPGSWRSCSSPDCSSSTTQTWEGSAVCPVETTRCPCDNATKTARLTSTSNTTRPHSPVLSVSPSHPFSLCFHSHCKQPQLEVYWNPFLIFIPSRSCVASPISILVSNATHFQSISHRNLEGIALSLSWNFPHLIIRN